MNTKLTWPIKDKMSIDYVLKRWKRLGIEVDKNDLIGLVENRIIATENGLITYVKSDVVELIETNTVLDESVVRQITSLQPFVESSNLTASEVLNKAIIRTNQQKQVDEVLKAVEAKPKTLEVKKPVIFGETILSTESVKQYEQDYLGINHNLPDETQAEPEKQTPEKFGTQQKRELVFKCWLKMSQIDVSQPMTLNQNQIWSELSKLDKNLFSLGEQGLSDFFKNQKYVNFPNGRNKTLIPLD